MLVVKGSRKGAKGDEQQRKRPTYGLQNIRILFPVMLSLERPDQTQANSFHLPNSLAKLSDSNCRLSMSLGHHRVHFGPQLRLVVKTSSHTCASLPSTAA